MEKIEINCQYLFEFKSFNDWVNNAKNYFAPHKYGKHLIALDTDNKVCHIGEDFMYCRANNKFPVKVYSVLRSCKTLESNAD